MGAILKRDAGESLLGQRPRQVREHSEGHLGDNSGKSSRCKGLRGCVLGQCGHSGESKGKRVGEAVRGADACRSPKDLFRFCSEMGSHWKDTSGKRCGN